MTLLETSSVRDTINELELENEELRYLIKSTINRLGIHNRNIRIYKDRLMVNEEYIKLIKDEEYNNNK